MESGKGMKTLRVSDQTHKGLTKLGVYGDTMEDIIKRLLEEHYQNQKGKGKWQGT